jgi:hypothetical protein
MSEWISVFDMLPAEATKGASDAVQYLVYVDIPNYGGNIQIAMWMNNRFAGFPQGDSDVTHWMPLPQTPETDK